MPPINRMLSPNGKDERVDLQVHPSPTNGLQADRMNENQGAEATLSFLLALLDMRSADRADITPHVAREMAL